MSRPIDDNRARVEGLHDDIARARASRPADLTDVDTLEEMLAKPLGTYDSDSHPDRPYRRNLEQKLAIARAKQARTEEVGAMTARQIVDQIPRGF